MRAYALPVAVERPLKRVRVAGRLLLAGVWWFEGPYRKVLHPGRQRDIVAAVPGLPAQAVTGALVGIATAEALLGAWVLTGARPRLAALTQTAALTTLNAAGLAVARQHIPHPGRMLARNATLLALAWALAAGTRDA
jgi:uncharacterized membrane protein YphA (DoxX/SURF4 family)